MVDLPLDRRGRRVDRADPGPGRVRRRRRAFLTALQAADATDGPGFGLASAWRGGPLTTYAGEAVTALRELRDEIDLDAAMAVWEAAAASRWERAPVWVHGDVALGNLLLRSGRLAAVIDFGCCATGDPACDTVIGWTELTGDARQAFRDGLELDDATWARGRGWALWKAAIVLVRARAENSPEADVQRRVIAEVLADHAARR